MLTGAKECILHWLAAEKRYSENAFGALLNKQHGVMCNITKDKSGELREFQRSPCRVGILGSRE